MNEDRIDTMNDEEVRTFAKALVESLELAEEAGIFGNESWHGFLGIEVEE